MEKLKNPARAEHLFAGWEESCIWSCLQGIMGEIYGDSQENPKSAFAILGDFIYFAGEPKEELLLLGEKIKKHEYVILVPQNQAWEGLMQQVFKERAEKKWRYSIKKEPGIFSLEKLEQAVQGLSKEYSVQLINKEYFYKCRELEWCREFTENYADYEMYQKWGLGVLILKGNEIVAGVSSYSGYQGGIEVDIVTRADYRKKGLAYVSAAKLILECEKRGWYPCWDARTRISVALAEKLGYHFSHEYVVYEIGKD